MSEFGISDNKGFHITFANGNTVSVQFGYGNYSDNYNFSGMRGEKVPASSTAEIAAWNSEDKWYEFEGGDEVKGYVSADEVAKFIKMISETEI